MLKGVKGRKRIFLFSPILFWQCSPVEERLTVNQDVEGSNPSVAVFVVNFRHIVPPICGIQPAFCIRDRRKVSLV